METRRDVFQAISDPTRREIIGILAAKKLNVNAISEHFEVSRQAISLHVKILQECNLITVTQQGRERVCEASLEGLSEVSQWTDQFRDFWTDKLLLLKHVVETGANASAPPVKRYPKFRIKIKKK